MWLIQGTLGPAGAVWCCRWVGSVAKWRPHVMAAILGLGTGGRGGQTRVGVTGPRVSWGGVPSLALTSTLTPHTPCSPCSLLWGKSSRFRVTGLLSRLAFAGCSLGTQTPQNSTISLFNPILPLSPSLPASQELFLTNFTALFYK